MAGYKETPRQKMIGMMYLVLTALLALNVSKQILDAFIVVNESMEVTNSNFSKKLANSYTKFERQYNDNKTKVGPFWEKAVKARQLSRDLEKFVDSLKYMVIMKTEKLDSYDSAKSLKLNYAKRVDNFDSPTQFFCGHTEDGSGGQSKILRLRIEKYKKEMLELVNPKFRSSIKMGMETDGKYMDANKNPQNWEMHNFYHTILAATVTILNKIKAEVYNAEFDVVNSIISEVSAEDYKFDVIKAKVIPESRFVFAGESYTAEIIVAAYESKGKITGKWLGGVESLSPANEGNAHAIEGPDGVVTLSIPAGGTGVQKFAGFLEVLDPNGQTKKYPFNEEYVVAKRSVSISPSQMLVFYKGVPNPLKIVVPGGGSDMQVAISYGTVTKTDTNYNVNIPASLTGGPVKAEVTVSAIYGDKRVTLGSETFRLKSIPEPDVSIGGLLIPNVSKSQLLANPIIYSTRPPGFDLTANYKVLSYRFLTNSPDGQSIDLQGTGRNLTDEMKNVLKNVRRNQQIMITEIKVEAPDGVRKIQKYISYRIN